MQIKYKKSGSFEYLYPKTLSENVEMNSGKSVEDWKKALDEDLANMEEKIEDYSKLINRKTTPLWKGEDVAGDSFSIKPDKKLTECFTGWIFCWQKVGTTQQSQYYHVPKYHLDLITTSGGTKMILSTQGSKALHKYLYVTNDSIKGHSSNSSGDEKDLALVAIYEY